mmetsp:Transcript_77648/g.215131  ORF Transcript_77648/g.215131 Transcript_77648/m.215131 type:complete len:97 (-) Transcript_77648:108-398(-)
MYRNRRKLATKLSSPASPPGAHPAAAAAVRPPDDVASPGQHGRSDWAPAPRVPENVWNKQQQQNGQKRLFGCRSPPQFGQNRIVGSMPHLEVAEAE